MDNAEIKMKEYDALKREILELQKRREQLFLYTITVLGFVLGFTLKTVGIPFIIISFIPYLIIINFCRATVISSNHIIIIGTYIRHFIEDSSPKALYWETVWDQIAKEKRKESKGYWYTFYLITSLTTCAGMLTLIIIDEDKLKPIILQSHPRTLFITIFALLHIIACTYCIIKGVQGIQVGKQNKNARERWNAHWENIKNQKRKENHKH